MGHNGYVPENLKLNDDTSMPALGFGLYKVPAEDAERVVTDGIAAGYRLIDGAAFYGNEAAVGRAVRTSGKRDRLTVTSKFWGDPVMTPEQLRSDFATTEAQLGVGAIDIYMIHWPRPLRGTYVDVWRAMIELREAGRIRSLAVCNFDAEQIQRLIDETGVPPVLNQVESHPWLPQHDLRAYHHEHGIVTQAWSPLGRGRLLQEPVLVDLAGRHGVSAAQVALRWHLQLGGSAVPKSARAERLRENIDVHGFSLSADDMARIASLESGQRTGTDPRDRQ